ncbi:MAG TPA: proline--tRNA ligase [Firmicutes bacterium]|nr:proline--tRNA ligase [Bacillota bacterium]
MKPEKEFVKAITPKGQDFSQWYVDVVLKAELADYAPVKGCIVFRPYGYTIWEYIQGELDRRFKELGHVNAYFPLFVPESFFRREAEHVAGFSPQVAWVTRGGDEELVERLAVRPTSETVIGAMYSKWIQSYRDLPVLINQWCNVVRWEKATRPFIRTTEFLWQEGHTCHRTEEEAEEEALRMLEVYRSFVEDFLAIPVVAGEKSPGERFAGAERTYTIEGLMSDGRALQCATSHFLGQNFARSFDIQFLDEDGQLKYVWQTSWGISTRIMGAIIMVHGDDRGLVLPPAVAPHQVVIVPIAGKDGEGVMAGVREVVNRLRRRVRVKLDDRPGYSAGWKFNDWEMRGVPLRLEVGPRDLAARQVTAARRDNGERSSVPLAELETGVEDLLRRVQTGLFERARAWREANTHEGESLEELRTVMEGPRGFIRAGWCGEDSCEERIKEETGATIRCLPFTQEPVPKCVCCGKEARHLVLLARAY